MGGGHRVEGHLHVVGVAAAAHFHAALPALGRLDGDRRLGHGTGV